MSSSRHRKMYVKRTMAAGSKPAAQEPTTESLSDYMIDHVLSFIPKSKTLDIIIDELNNGKVHRISRRQE